jgi:hypothetical protein
MVDAVCPFCQNTGFELRGEPISGSAPALPIVRCSACGAPVSVLQGADVGQALNQQVEQIRQLSALMTDVHRRLIDIEGRMSKILPQRVGT